MRDEDLQQIMAYHDGELTPEQVAKVEQVLAESEEAKRFLAQLQRSDQFLRGGLDEVLDQPVPQHLIDAARGEPGKPRERAPVLAFPRWRWASRWAYATAASVTLLAVAGTYILSGQSGGEDSRRLARALNQGLETTASGEIFRADDPAVQVMPTATFRTTEAGVCRQYVVKVDGSQSVGLACRQEPSQWQVQVQQTVSSGDQSQAYAPASGGDDEVLAAAIDALGGGQPLNSEQEMTLISNNWKQ